MTCIGHASRMAFLLHVSFPLLPGSTQTLSFNFNIEFLWSKWAYNFAKPDKTENHQDPRITLLNPVRLHSIWSCQCRVLFQWFCSHLYICHTSYGIIFRKFQRSKKFIHCENTRIWDCCLYQNLLLFFLTFPPKEAFILKAFVEPWILHTPKMSWILFRSTYSFVACYFHRCKIFLLNYYLQMDFRKKYSIVIEYCVKKKNLPSFSE